MILSWHPDAWNAYLQWNKRDKNTFKRINALIQDTLRHPAEGIGKPEPLKFELTGLWSRRISAEHRLVYWFDEKQVMIVGCETHYEC